MSEELVNTYHVPSGGLHCVSLPDDMYEDEARKFVRDILGVKRLPNGTAFWHKKPVNFRTYE